MSKKLLFSEIIHNYREETKTLIGLFQVWYLCWIGFDGYTYPINLNI